MKLSHPIYHLKRKARLLARDTGVALHLALDRVAAAEGFNSWSQLAAAFPRSTARTIFRLLNPGELVLVGARPGHGKTMLGLELVLEAVRAGRHGAVFTLEWTAQQVRSRLLVLSAEATHSTAHVDLYDSDAIDADTIIDRLAKAPRGTLALVDYLQLLDRPRRTLPLMEQIERLRGFAARRELTLVVTAQIKRSFDAEGKSCPDLRDVHLPNPLDLSLFDRSCFLHDGQVRVSASHA